MWQYNTLRNNDGHSEEYAGICLFVMAYSTNKKKKSRKAENKKRVNSLQRIRGFKDTVVYYIRGELPVFRSSIYGDSESRSVGSAGSIEEQRNNDSAHDKRYFVIASL